MLCSAVVYGGPVGRAHELLTWSLTRNTKSNFEVKLRAQDAERKAQSAMRRAQGAERKAQSARRRAQGAERKAINALWDMIGFRYVTAIHVSYKSTLALRAFSISHRTGERVTSLPARTEHEPHRSLCGK